MTDEVKEEVKNAINGDGGEPSTPEKPEEATPQGVKPEVKPEDNPEAKLEKEKEDEINRNLNIALKQEREERKKLEQKAAELEAKAKEDQEFRERLKNAVVPENKEPETQTPSYLTKEDLESFLQQKEEESKRASIEKSREDRVKNELNDLKKEWDGVDGKPKFDDTKDSEMLKWQKENDKLYLFPKDAFVAWQKDAIIDWEVKQRLAGKKPVEPVLTPGGSPETHEPTDEKIPKTEEELKAAIEEAVNKG